MPFLNDSYWLKIGAFLKNENCDSLALIPKPPNGSINSTMIVGLNFIIFLTSYFTVVVLVQK